MIIRKNVLSLGAPERKAFVDALLAMKHGEKKVYDGFVRVHVDAMMRIAAFPSEPQDMTYRNLAHSGPVFLPWHRNLLLEFEAELQKIDSAVSLPYWDWAADGMLNNPAKSPLWAADLMGGDGDGPNNTVVTGAFAGADNWPIVIDTDGTGPALVRTFGKVVNTLPTQEHVMMLMREAFYDVPPWSATSPVGFRNRLEGWLTRRQDYRYYAEGSQMHNRVHLWIGGNMLADSSPNDPAFWLNHCFIDKLWSDWQRARLVEQHAMMETMHRIGMHDHDMPMGREAAYVPQRDGPPGHNLDDAMYPWKATPREMLDPAQLGYRYDTDPAEDADHGGHGMLMGATALDWSKPREAAFTRRRWSFD